MAITARPPCLGKHLTLVFFFSMALNFMVIMAYIPYKVNFSSSKTGLLNGVLTASTGLSQILQGN